MHINLHGVVLHHLATLFDNINAVSKPEHGDHIYEILGVSLPNTNNLLQTILPKCRQNSVKFFSLKFKRFTLTMDTILIVLA